MDLFRNIFAGSHKPVPKEVRTSLESHFSGATGIEWSTLDKKYEAVFYHEESEKIARFDSDGKLTEYRSNILPDKIPSPIREAASVDYEIMNCIAIYTADKLTYELVVRDSALARYQMNLDSLGTLTNVTRL